MNEHGLVKFDRLEKLLVLLADWEKEKFSELHPSASKHKSQQKSRKGNYGNRVCNLYLIWYY